MILICVSLVISGLTYFNLPAGYLYSLENAYSGHWPIFKIGFLGLLFMSFVSSLYILSINPLLHQWFGNIFSHNTGCLFLLLMVSFTGQKVFSLTESHLLIFGFCCLCFWCHIHMTDKIVNKIRILPSC